MIVLGSVLGTVRFIADVAALARLRRRLRRMQAKPTTYRFPDLAGPSQRVTVMEAQCKLAPLSVGWRSPEIYVSAELAEEEQRMAVMHELAHLKLGDHVWVFLERAINALFWWFPPVMMLMRQVRTFREEACDALVLGRGSVSVRSYASLVLKYAAEPKPATFLALGMASSPSNTHQRIKIMSNVSTTLPDNAHRIGLRLFIAMALLIGAGMGATRALAQTEPEAAEIAIVDMGLEGYYQWMIDQVSRVGSVGRRPLVMVNGHIHPGDVKQLNPAAIHGLSSWTSSQAVMNFGVSAEFGAIDFSSGRDTSTVSRLVPAEGVFATVEQMPELVGGLEALQRTLIYPEMARAAGIEGRVFVQFVINPDGTVRNAEVVRGVGAGLDEAALNAVRQARFIPGRQGGIPVAVRFSLPITFRLAPEQRPEVRPSPWDRPILADTTAKLGETLTLLRAGFQPIALQLSASLILPSDASVRFQLMDSAGSEIRTFPWTPARAAFPQELLANLIGVPPGSYEFTITADYGDSRESISRDLEIRGQ